MVLTLVLATLVPDLEEAVRTRYGASNVVSVTFMGALPMFPWGKGGEEEATVVLSETMVGTVAWADAVSMVDRVRRQGVRVVYLGSRDTPRAWLREWVARGVYDLLLADALALDELWARLEHPATYADAADFLSGEAPFTPPPPSRARLSVRSKTPQAPSVPPLRRRTKKGFENSDKAFVVAGVPGAGVSYAAVQAALWTAQTTTVALVEDSARPIFARWFGIPPGIPTRDTWRRGEKLWQLQDRLYVLPSTSGEGSRDLDWDALPVEVVVLDVGGETIPERVDRLVIPPDVAKAQSLQAVQTKEVWVNLAPQPLPMDVTEYGMGWPEAKICARPLDGSWLTSLVTQRFALAATKRPGKVSMIPADS